MNPSNKSLGMITIILAIGLTASAGWVFWPESKGNDAAGNQNGTEN